MNLRPFHRWKSFWFGIFIIASLCWSWGRSTRFEESVCLGPPRFGYYLMLVQSDKVLSVVSAGSPDHGAMICAVPLFGSDRSKVSVWSNAGGRSVPGIPWAVESHSEPHLWRVEIAHWLLILLFAIIWITWMVRRARRFKRLVSLQGRDPTSGRSGWGESP
jgi:hypothetical protein